MRAKTADPDHAVVWRSGVHLRGTSIWCDARRGRELCFVSRADLVPGVLHGQLIATKETVAQLARPHLSAQDSQLAVPLGRPFSLGTTRLELFPSGSALGAASLLVDTGERRVIYAGVVNPRGGGLGGTAEQRTADALVVSTSHGDPRFVLPALEDAVDQLVSWVRAVTLAGGAAVLLVPRVLDGLDLLHALAKSGVAAPVLAHRSIHHAVRRLEVAKVEVPPVRRYSGARVPGGAVLVWPQAARRKLDPVKLPAGSKVALVAGAALVPELVTAARADHGIPLSFEADYPALLEYIAGAGARSIYVIGAGTAPLLERLAQGGKSAQVLGPPTQMSLFG